MISFQIICRHFVGLAIAVLTVVLISGCQSMYYGAMEKFGIEKRDILVDRVDSARESQQETKEQFESALMQFIAVTNYSGGDLEKQYNKLKDAYEDSEAQASEIRARIAAVERVADDLFSEWKKELKMYTNKELKRASARQLKSTQNAYGTLIATMQKAEKKMKPVLGAFLDRVLFLKHNLNANAISALRAEKHKIESDIVALIRDMNKSIEEADQFINVMSAE
ncbi:MAG: DUF2959 domain-containing protein [Gammaproteobacteria bacterium]|nr:DUF2959 domain-containing protein [Gammaproteobacteria bacterium]